MESIFEIALACILSTVLFASLIIYISKHPQKRTMPLKIAFVIMFAGGIFIYCTCHYRVLELAINGQLDDSSLEWVRNSNADDDNVSNDKGVSWYHIPYIIERAVIDVGMKSADSVFVLADTSDSFLHCSYGTVNTFRE